MPTKKTTKKADVWDEVKPVKSTVTPEKVGDNPEEGSPFGSVTPLMGLIAGFRKEVLENEIPMNGRATAPNGTVYAYYLSEDVLQAAYEYCDKHQAFLDLGMYVNELGFNTMRLSLTDIKSGDEKVIEANLGSMQSTADFGTRITYAPKYLVAMMFGISVQTDSDAFNNGKTTKNDTNSNNSSVPSAPVSGDGTEDGKPNGQNDVHSVPADNGAGVPSNRGSVEHSASYPVAKQFIERALNISMLDTAESKVNTAKQLFDHERIELMGLISEKRKELK